VQKSRAPKCSASTIACVIGCEIAKGQSTALGDGPLVAQEWNLEIGRGSTVDRPRTSLSSGDPLCEFRSECRLLSRRTEPNRLCGARYEQCFKEAQWAYDQAIAGRNGKDHQCSTRAKMCRETTPRAALFARASIAAERVGGGGIRDILGCLTTTPVTFVHLLVSQALSNCVRFYER
jgi:hypothetical protein